MIFNRAYEIHAAACLSFRRVRLDCRLAAPFGTPEGMPPHEWRVSPDVYQALYEASPLPYPIPNPKSGRDGKTRLFGWLVNRDPELPVGSMLLELVQGSSVIEIDPVDVLLHGFDEAVLMAYWRHQFTVATPVATRPGRSES